MLRTANRLMDENRERDEGLVRAIGTKALGLNIVNMVVGGGIFVLPGLIALHLGSAAIFAYIVCSVAVALIFLCFAEVGSRVTRSGGAYTYIEEAFGPFAGFVTSILFWFGWSVLSDAAITVAMVETMAVAFPSLREPVPRSILIIAIVGFMAFANIVGVRSGIRVFVFNTIAKLVPLLLLLIVGMFAINPQFLVIERLPSIESVGVASLILFFAFSGAESGLNAGGEIKDPGKTVPKGLLLGLGGILILYVGLQTVSQGVLGPALANNTEAPLAAAATEVFGEWGAKMLVVGGVISIFATVSGDMLNAPRVIFASARDGNLPSALSKVHPRYKTPHVAIVFFATVMCGFALSGQFEQLAVVASGSILVIYGGVCLAVIKLRHRDGLPAAGQFAIPGGPVVPILACVLVIWLLSQLSAEEAVGFAALAGTAVALYGGKVLLSRSRAGG